MSIYLIITSANVHNERRFDKSLTLTKFKQRLEPITGISSSNQKLSLYNGEVFIQDLVPFDGKPEDEVMLGAFFVEDNSRVHVTDVSDVSGIKYRTQFGDLSNVNKYEMEQEEYARRQDSVLAFKERNKLGRFANPSDKSTTNLEDVDLSNFTLESRCKVVLNSQGAVGFGTIKFVGKTEFLKEGYWIGIELDEPSGKNDGSVQGVRYFQCLQNYGVFVRPNKVEVGDFAKKDIFDELEELEEL